MRTCGMTRYFRAGFAEFPVLVGGEQTKHVRRGGPQVPHYHEAWGPTAGVFCSATPLLSKSINTSISVNGRGSEYHFITENRIDEVERPIARTPRGRMRASTKNIPVDIRY